MTTERRRYYRIEDRALIKYRVISDGMLDDERRFIFLNELKVENVRAALMGIDIRLLEVIDALQQKNRLVAEALDLINRKLMLIERVVALEGGPASSEHSEHELSWVSLSAGGLALTAETPLALNACLAIDMILLPSNHPMRIVGRVIDCRSDDDGGFSIAIEFEDIRDEDREVLVQHVLRKQSAVLREQRREGNVDAA